MKPRCSYATGDEECLPFSEPRKMKGVWIRYSEPAIFFENAFKFEKSMANDGTTWIMSSRHLAANPGSRKYDYSEGAFLAEIIGRSALCPSGYGHLNGYKNEILVDDIISQKKIG